MFDESILELEEIEGEDRWHPSVVEARYKTYRDAKEWELAMTMARVLAEGMPDRFDWLLNYADAHHQLGDTEKAIECLKDAEGRFCEEAEYLFRQGKYHAILGNVEEAKNLVRRVFKLNGSFKADFLDDPAFDSVWESF
jgi:tetratricopeptide (TPR) repeat protein